MLKADHYRSTRIEEPSRLRLLLWPYLRWFISSILFVFPIVSLFIPLLFPYLSSSVSHLESTLQFLPIAIQFTNSHPSQRILYLYPRQSLTIWLLPLTRMPGLCLAYLSITLLVWQTRASARLSQSESWLTQNDSGNFAKTSAGTNWLLMNFNIWGTL